MANMGERRGIKRAFGGKPLEKRSLGRWENDIKVDH
jgi:hypothetical protein